MRSMVQQVALILCFAFLFACSHKAPATLPDGAVLGFGDFVEQVLKPLATERAEEVLVQEKARITDQYSGFSLTAIGVAAGAAVGAYSSAGLGTGVGAAVGGAIGRAIDAKREADRKQALGRAEAQKIALQQRLLERFTERTTVDEPIYALCAMGKYRRYEVRGARFVRLQDDPAVPCPLQVLPIYADMTE
jgi:hypothetical protein